MNFQQLISNITPDIYAALKRGLEIGKWPSGILLTSEQKSLVMEALISYEQLHVAEQDRVGFIDRGSKKEGEVCNDDLNNPASNSPIETLLKWTH